MWCFGLKRFNIKALMNTTFNLVKFLPTTEVRNNLDGNSRFLALEDLFFCKSDHFSILSFVGFYDFIVFAVFYLYYLPGFIYHLGLNFCLLGMILKLFSTLRWVERIVDWNPGWIVNRTWQILEKLVYHWLIGVHSYHIWPWFALFWSGYYDERQYNLET